MIKKKVGEIEYEFETVEQLINFENGKVMATVAIKKKKDKSDIKKLAASYRKKIYMRDYMRKRYAKLRLEKKRKMSRR